MSPALKRRLVWLAVFAACLIPLGMLAYAFWTDDLGADPVETIIRTTGDWAIRFVVLGLLITPARQILRWNAPARFRRMIGLFAFFYVCLHLSTYLVIDQGLDGASILKDILKRPYITVGMGAFLILLPLAATSTNGMVKRLGGPRWRRLHRAVYAAGVLAVVHYYLLVKLDVTRPLAYGSALAAALLWRAYEARRKRSAPRYPRGRPAAAAAPRGL